MLDENDVSTAKSEEVCCFIVYHPQGTQGQSVGPGEMARRKFSNTGSCAVYSPSFPNQTKELPMSRKMFRMLSA